MNDPRSAASPARQPKGQPTGGQFAAKSNPECDVEISTDQESIQRDLSSSIERLRAEWTGDNDFDRAMDRWLDTIRQYAGEPEVLEAVMSNTDAWGYVRCREVGIGHSEIMEAQRAGLHLHTYADEAIRQKRGSSRFPDFTDPPPSL